MFKRPKLMGESDLKIIFRHIVPQLLPFTLTNFALAVPAAILYESSLSFLGLGDPYFPTWGQMSTRCTCSICRNSWILVVAYFHLGL